MLGVVKSSILYILNKKENTSELRNTKKPRRPRENNCGERHEGKTPSQQSAWSSAGCWRISFKVNNQVNITRGNAEGLPHDVNQEDQISVCQKAHTILEQYSLDEWDRVKWTGRDHLLRFSQMLHNSLNGASLCRWLKVNLESNPRF